MFGIRLCILNTSADLLATACGVFHPAAASRTEFVILFFALWVNFGTTLRPSLAWMWHRPTLASVLGAIGGTMGGAAAYAGFNGYQASTINFQTFSQVAFAFRVTPDLLVLGLSYALVMGLIGGLLPALRAASLPIPSALREL